MLNKLLTIRLALAFAILMATPAHATPNTLDPSPGVSLADGGELPPGRTDVLIDRHGLCSWIGNESPQSSYFVPYSQSDEWHAFVSNAPDEVNRAACCQPANVQFNAADLKPGDPRYVNYVLGLGRNDSVGANGATVVSQPFQFTRDDCTTHWNGEKTCNTTTWTMTDTRSFLCTNGEWMLVDRSVSGFEAPENKPPYIGPKACPPNIAHNQYYWNVTDNRSRAPTADECPYGPGTRKWVWDVNSQFHCWNGNTGPTGSTADINGHWEGACQEEPFVDPTPGCFLHAEGAIISDKPDLANGVATANRLFDPVVITGVVNGITYNVKTADVVGKGQAARTRDFFPNANATTFDSIAIGPKTRVRIWSGENFTGNVVLDKTGPSIIYNTIWQQFDPRLLHPQNYVSETAVRTVGDAIRAVMVKAFEGIMPGTTIPKNTMFPPSVREWSTSNMHPWGTTGSIEVTCEE